MENLPKIIIIEGTNASGKSSLGIELAKKYNGEIISADSRQIYRGFDLCCGKITEEEKKTVPHHMLDILDVGTFFSVYDFQKEAYRLISEIISRGKLPFIVGGTGLYVASVAKGFSFPYEKPDEEYTAELESKTLEELQKMIPDDEIQNVDESSMQNKRRLIRIIERAFREKNCVRTGYDPKVNALQIGVTWPRGTLRDRIDERLDKRLEEGMINEVKDYIEAGGNPDDLSALGLEYKHIAMYLKGEYESFDAFRYALANAIKRFAKRQRTWFRRDDTIHWIDMTGNYFDDACALIDDFLNY